MVVDGAEGFNLIKHYLCFKFTETWSGTALAGTNPDVIDHRALYGHPFVVWITFVPLLDIIDDVGSSIVGRFDTS
jgi:hypothetical protein